MTTKPTHITRGDIFDDLGFSRSEASALKVKADLLNAILHEIENRGYSQRQLVDILDEYQPGVSNLLQGKISKVSIEKLLHYSDRLHIRVNLTTETTRKSKSQVRSSHTRAEKALATATA